MDGNPGANTDGSYNVDEWKRFYEGHIEPMDEPSLKEQRMMLLAEQTREKRRENEVAEGKLVDVETLLKQVGPALSRVREMMAQKIEQEMPTALAGVDVPTGRIIAARLADEMFAEFKKCFETWGAEKT